MSERNDALLDAPPVAMTTKQIKGFHPETGAAVHVDCLDCAKRVKQGKRTVCGEKASIRWNQAVVIFGWCSDFAPEPGVRICDPMSLPKPKPARKPRAPQAKDSGAVDMTAAD